jgi:hypothetical protein
MVSFNRISSFSMKMIEKFVGTSPVFIVRTCPLDPEVAVEEEETEAHAEEEDTEEHVAVTSDADKNVGRPPPAILRSTTNLLRNKRKDRLFKLYREK